MRRSLKKLQIFLKRQRGRSQIFLTYLTLAYEMFLFFFNPRKIRENFQNSLKKTKGAVVLELALSIPVFLALLYYMHDVPKLQSIQNRVRFGTMCGVNMFQNVTQNRADEKVSRADFLRITCMAEMPFIGGGVQHYSSTVSGKSPIQIQSQFTLFYVKGVSSTKARIYWGVTNNGCGYPGLRTSAGLITSGTPSWQWVTVIKVPIGRDVDQSSIHEDLHIKAGEVAMIVDQAFFAAGTKSAKKLFGFLVYNPQPPAGCQNTLFHSVVIFAPKPGLFSEAPSGSYL